MASKFLVGAHPGCSVPDRMRRGGALPEYGDGGEARGRHPRDERGWGNYEY